MTTPVITSHHKRTHLHCHLKPISNKCVQPCTLGDNDDHHHHHHHDGHDGIPETPNLTLPLTQPNLT